MAVSPQLTTAAKLSLKIARRTIAQSELNKARARGSVTQVEQLHALVKSLDEQIAELDEQQAQAPQLPHRKDTDD